MRPLELGAATSFAGICIGNGSPHVLVAIDAVRVHYGTLNCLIKHFVAREKSTAGLKTLWTMSHSKVYFNSIICKSHKRENLLRSDSKDPLGPESLQISKSKFGAPLQFSLSGRSLRCWRSA